MPSLGEEEAEDLYLGMGTEKRRVNGDPPAAVLVRCCQMGVLTRLAVRKLFQVGFTLTPASACRKRLRVAFQALPAAPRQTVTGGRAATGMSDLRRWHGAFSASLHEEYTDGLHT